VVRGELPRESALEVIATAFPVDRAAADRMLGAVGRGFEPTPAAPPPPVSTPPVSTPPGEE
jgi:hypothetical protein